MCSFLCFGNEVVEAVLVGSDFVAKFYVEGTSCTRCGLQLGDDNGADPVWYQNCAVKL